jgi:hypothetical protein
MFFYLKFNGKLNNNAKKSILKHCFDIDFAIDIAIVLFLKSYSSQTMKQ